MGSQTKARPNKKVKPPKRQKHQAKSCCENHGLRCFFGAPHMWGFRVADAKIVDGERRCLDCGSVCTVKGFDPSVPS